MKKFVFSTIAAVAILSIALCLNAQPAGGGMGGAGGGMMGGGAGMMGGGARGLRARPEKAARLASVKELDKQVAALKAAIEKGPDKDPNLVTIKDADLTKFMDTYTVESNAINTIQATLTSLQRVAGAGAGMGRMGAGGPTEAVLTELAALAKDEKATKTAARIDALIQQAQQAATRGGGAGAGGGAGRGGAGAGGGRGGRGGAQQ